MHDSSTILLTGATGFVGRHLARKLVARGLRVRCLLRPSSDFHSLKDLPVEPVIGDLRDLDSLRNAIAGCRTVYHLAADYRLWSPDPRALYETNVIGTRNLLMAAAEADCERFIHCSSVASIACRSDGIPSDEDTPTTLTEIVGDYKRSKYLAEIEALHAAAYGLPVVIVNPSAPIGPGDARPTETGRIITRFLNGRMPFYLDTGLNLIDVEDVAEGHILAAERGRIGERYILANQNLTLLDILRCIAHVFGRTAPKRRIPYRAALLLAHAEQFVSTRVLRRAPSIPLDGVRMARHRMFYSSAKAVGELGLPQSSVRAAIVRAGNWFSEHGYVSRAITVTDELQSMSVTSA